MSILSCMPTGWLDDYYQPADLVDDEDDDAPPPAILADLMTINYGVVWFTAAPDLSDE